MMDTPTSSCVSSASRASTPSTVAESTPSSCAVARWSSLTARSGAIDATEAGVCWRASCPAARRRLVVCLFVCLCLFV